MSQRRYAPNHRPSIDKRYLGDFRVHPRINLTTPWNLIVMIQISEYLPPFMHEVPPGKSVSESIGVLSTVTRAFGSLQRAA